MSGPGPLESQVPVISPADLAVLLAGKPKGLHLLDTRGRGEFEKAHIPGSFHCPVHELSRRTKELPPHGATVVVIGEAGKRGLTGAIFCVLAGFGSVLLLEGGFPAWTGPVESGPARPLSESRPPKPPGWVDPPSR